MREGARRMKKNKHQRIIEKREKIRNRHLCKKYHWLKPWAGWKGDKEYYGWLRKRGDKKYSYIMWDFWPKGWNKTIAPLLLEELGEVVKRSGLQDKFHIVDGKEKWGRLVLDCSPVNNEIDEVITKYEIISEHVCVYCGMPDVWMTSYGWVEPICFNCFHKIHNRTGGSKIDFAAVYNRSKCGESERIPDSYISNFYINGSSKQSKEIFIKDTADRIRRKWHVY
jgi:hypothetical protein